MIWSWQDHLFGLSVQSSLDHDKKVLSFTLANTSDAGDILNSLSPLATRWASNVSLLKHTDRVRRALPSMKMMTNFMLIVMAWAMVGPGGVSGAWFEDYVNTKDKVDLDDEGEILDILVDDQGKSKKQTFIRLDGD